MLYCKDCEIFIKFGGNEEEGVCSLPESYFMVKKSDPCVFLQPIKQTCKQCSRFRKDSACFTVSADDDAADCPGYIDKLEDDFFNVLYEWMKTGKYSREEINRLCASFEETDLYKFIEAHKNSL